MTPVAWFLLAVAALMFTADAVRKVRLRRRIKPRHRQAMHSLRVRYGRPGLGRRVR